MLSTKDGVKRAKVDLKQNEALVEYIPSKLTPEDIAEQIEDMGFEAYPKTVNGRRLTPGNYNFLQVIQTKYKILFLFLE